MDNNVHNYQSHRQKANAVFNLYSKGCEYAIRVLVKAIQDNSQSIDLPAICRKSKISESYARKAFQNLSRNSILKATRGPGGGYIFCPPAPKISLYQLILAIDGDEAFDHCVMGLPECHDKNPCVFHITWVKMKEDAINRLKSKTLEELALKGSTKQKRKERAIK